MSLKERILEDLKLAMREREETSRGALRMLVASLTNKEKEAGQEGELTDEQVREVVAQEMKKRREAAEAFEKGDREELAQQERAEAEVIGAYLPEQLSDEELVSLAREAVSESGASSLQDTGKVMGALMPKVKGRAEGGRVQDIVKRLLSER